jgi:UDP-3-O-[3-hydroxymyristoyl] glucosamine N-acyltransferase LpxD
MFSGNKILLSDFHNHFGLRVIRNCEFSFVGKIPTNLDDRIVSCIDELQIKEMLRSRGIAGVITTKNLVEKIPDFLGLAVSEHPWSSTIELQERIAAMPDFQWKKFGSIIHKSVEIMQNAYVSDYDVVIGKGTIVHPNAIIYPRVIIGENCSIGPGAVIGCDAFEVITSVSPHRIIQQSGGVRLGNSVDIQAKCTVVRATFGGFTELGDETKLDCQVHFAHDCVTGKRVRVAACAEISGRVQIGDDTFIGPNASIRNGISIGRRSKVSMGSVVTRAVPDDSTVTGNFAVDHRKWINFMRSFK